MVAWLVFLALIFYPLVPTGWADSVGIANGNGAAINSCLNCHSDQLSSYLCTSPLKSAARQGCVWCHRGNAATSRKDLAHNNLIGKDYASYRLPEAEVVSAGVTWVGTLACRRCHVQNNQGSRLATNLDQLLMRASIAEIERAIAEPAFYMPQFALNASVRQAVITQILAGGSTHPSGQLAAPVVVHFADNVNQETLFEKHCGSCHRVLTARHGGLGDGVQGPNLSGLLSEFYPCNYLNNQSWTAAALHDWIKNPRKIRPLTTMPPLVLDKQLLQQLIDDTWPE